MEQAGQPHCLGEQFGSGGLLADRCRVAGGHQCRDDVVDGVEALGQPVGWRWRQGHAADPQLALGPDDALGRGRPRDQRGRRDLLGGQADDAAQRQRNPCLQRQRWVAAARHETQQVGVATRRWGLPHPQQLDGRRIDAALLGR